MLASASPTVTVVVDGNATVLCAGHGTGFGIYRDNLDSVTPTRLRRPPKRIIAAASPVLLLLFIIIYHYLSSPSSPSVFVTVKHYRRCRRCACAPPVNHRPLPRTRFSYRLSSTCSVVQVPSVRKSRRVLETPRDVSGLLIFFNTFY